MSWARLDDGFHDHPKVAPLANRNDPLNVWVRLLSWCSKHRTRGAIPRDVALVFGSKKTLTKLVDRRLFEETADGYQFHDFAVYASKQDGQVDPELSAKRAEAGRRGGLRSVEARRPEQEVPDPPDQANAEASLLQTDQATCLKQTKQNAPSRADARARPDPDPVPSRPDHESERAHTLEIASNPALRALSAGRDLYPPPEVSEDAVRQAAARIVSAVEREPAARRDGVTAEIATSEAVAATREYRARYPQATPAAMLARVESHVVRFILGDCRAGKRRRVDVKGDPTTDPSHELAEMERTEAETRATARASQAARAEASLGATALAALAGPRGGA